MGKNYYRSIILIFAILFFKFGLSAGQDWSWYLNYDFFNPSGVNPPRYNSPYIYDIDNDNDLDLVLGTGDGTIELYYNDGFPDVERWRLDRDYFGDLSFDFAVLPSLGDFDGDDSLELVLGFSYWGLPADSLRVFRDRGYPGNPVWEEISGFFNFSTEGYIYYKFIDWESDDDYDLVFSQMDGWGTPYIFFRNGGEPGSPLWEVDSTITNALPSYISSCGIEGFDIVDLNSDGAWDFVSGYLVCDDGSEISIFLNEGTNADPVFGYPVGGFPLYLGTSVDISAGDLDFDGDLDLLAAGYFPLVQFYRNNGNYHSPDFNGVGDMTLGPFYLDGGEDIAFFDKDNDNDLDFALLYAFVLGPVWSHNVSWTTFENRGNQSIPDFINRNWLPWWYARYTDMGWSHGDLNDDGWEDLVCSFQGHLWAFINTPYSQFIFNDSLFSEIDISTAHPELVDLDSDGDLDLFVIDTTANELTTFENTGTPQESHWQRHDEWVDGLDLSASFVRAADLNNDNLIDLILKVGAQLKGFINAGNSDNPAFEFVPQIFEGWEDYTVSYFDVADLDGDGDDDIILDQDGAILLLENEQVLGVENRERPEGPFILGNYPNPFNASTIISFAIHEPGKVTIDIYDLGGRLVKSLLNKHMDAGMHRIDWNGVADNGNSVSSGIYFCLIKSASFESSKNMMLIK